MHDIRAIREAPEAFDAALARRGLAPLSGKILALDEARRACIQRSETALAERNAASKEVGKAKAHGNEAEFERLRALVAAKKDEIAALEEEAREKDAALRDLLSGIPNLPAADIPDGADENDNVETRRWGTPREFDFTPKEHFEITGAAPGLDFETAAKLSGSRFVVMQGAVARLHRALAQFMLDVHTTENGLTEINGPVLVRAETMYGTGQLPKFGEDSYETTNGWWLIPTSEVSITNPDASDDEQQRMLRCAEGILERLGLPYRTVVLCTGDMGFGARRTFDIEVWLPGQNTYREISSVSTCGDFQARRMNARFRPAKTKTGGGGKLEFVHTLNGSGLAVGRCLIAVLENGQEADGSIQLPEALHPYLGGKSRITPEGQLV